MYTIPETMTIFDFDTESSLQEWFVVNDGVMGGLSEGQLYMNDQGHAVFEGNVSTDNYGGFTSIRHSFSTKKIKGKTQALLHLKGDGKSYQFRVKEDSDDRYSYIYQFDTNGEWETIEIPLGEMYASFRGRKLDIPNFACTQIEEVAFLIANNRDEQFQLLLDRVEFL